MKFLEVFTNISEADRKLRDKIIYLLYSITNQEAKENELGEHFSIKKKF